MEPIGTHGLACLGDEDYADYARFMQCQAETIDSTLFEQFTALDDFLLRPTAIARTVLDRTFASGTTVSNFFTEFVYINNDFMSLSTVGSETFINVGSPVGGDVVPYLPGLYLVGAQALFDATGAVTAFSQRNLTINAQDDTLPEPNQIALANDINPDANTAITGIFTNASFTMVLRGTHGVKIGHALSHTNAASTVTVFSSESLLWVTYLGPNELVEVS
jgi:hypothetical protein